MEQSSSSTNTRGSITRAQLLWVVSGLVQFICVLVAINLRALYVFAPSTARPPIAHYLFGRFEPLAALLSSGVFALAVIVLASSKPAPLGRLLDEPAEHTPRTALLLWAVAMVPIAYVVHQRYPLSMDEYAQSFQADVFARGRLTGVVPYDMWPWISPFGRDYFFIIERPGIIYSEYEPGWSLLLVPFALLDAKWLANVVVSALTLAVCWRLVLAMGGSRRAAWIGCVLLALSPFFVVYATTFYSMPAHLLGNALFALLCLRGSPRASLGAGVVGSIALNLHQPVPHALFAIPWHVRLIARREWKPLFAMWAGYVPGAVAVLVWRAHISARGGHVGAVSGFGFSAMHALWHVEAWVEFVLWSLPAVLVLVVKGLEGARKEHRDRLYLAASFALTAAFFLTFMHQGHGWGHRYVHPAQISVVVLAALGADAFLRERAESARWIAALIVGTAAVLVPYRLWEVHGVVSELSRWNRVARSRPGLVFVRIQPAYYALDSVRNDPFLRSERLILRSLGPEFDRRVARGAPHVPTWLVYLDERTDAPAIRAYPLLGAATPGPAAPLPIR